jgi:hypothetical protein
MTAVHQLVHKNSTEVTTTVQKSPANNSNSTEVTTYQQYSCFYISIGKAVNTKQHSSTEGTTLIMTIQQSQKQNNKMKAQHKSKTVRPWPYQTERVLPTYLF